MTPSEIELEGVAAIRAAIAAIDAFMQDAHDMEPFADLVEREGPRVAAGALGYVLGTVVDGLAGNFGMTRLQLWAELRGRLEYRLSDRETVARLFAD